MFNRRVFMQALSATPLVAAGVPNPKVKDDLRAKLIHVDIPTATHRAYDFGFMKVDILTRFEESNPQRVLVYPTNANLFFPQKDGMVRSWSPSDHGIPIDLYDFEGDSWDLDRLLQMSCIYWGEPTYTNVSDTDPFGLYITGENGTEVLIIDVTRLLSIQQLIRA